MSLVALAPRSVGVARRGAIREVAAFAVFMEMVLVWSPEAPRTTLCRVHCDPVKQKIRMLRHCRNFRQGSLLPVPPPMCPLHVLLRRVRATATGWRAPHASWKRLA